MESIVGEVSNNVVTNPKDIGTINVSLTKGPQCFTITDGGNCISDYITPTAINTCGGTNEWDTEFTSNVGSYLCENNYWAGAKKACADIGMVLPTQEQFETLALKDNWPGKPQHFIDTFFTSEK